MMHHLGQKASASWVPATVRQHGLEVFVPIGYLLVSFFFFCSGYGLIKSMNSKEDYFKGFLIKRLNRLLMVFVITQIIYFVFRIVYSVLGLPVNPYSWYVYTIIVLYIGFFLIYRKFGDKKKTALILMAAWILAYSIICYLQIRGNWWINSAPVFLVGIYIADHEKSEKPDKKKSIIGFTVLGVIFIAAFILSENLPAIYNMLHLTNYGIINFVIVLLQIVCGSAFSLIFYKIAVLTTKEVKEGEEESEMRDGFLRKAMLFYGEMTLEFYLIHGLFVQLFGHHFMNDTTKPVCYIKNIFVYVIVVFIVATAAAFAIKKVADLLIGLYEKAPTFRKFCNDQKRYCIIVIAIIAVITVISGVNRYKTSADAKPELEKYQKEFITNVDVNGTSVATYVVGEGDYTVVLLGSEDNPCSTLYLRPVADKISDRYKVIVIDYPGKGFSDESDAERTNDFFVDVIHQTLGKLGIAENIILVPDLTSGLYAYKYIDKYPAEVAGFVGVDALVPAAATHFLEGNYNNVDEYVWFMKRIVRYEGLLQKLMVGTGYIKVQMPIYEYLFYGSGLKKYYPIMEEMFVRRYMQEAELGEQAIIYDNCMEVADFKLPSDMPAEFLLDDWIKSNNMFGVKWSSQYKKMITNEDIQSVDLITGDPYVIYYNPDIIAKKIDDLMERIEN